MKSKAARDVISVFGAVILFFTWIFQSTSVARMDRALARLDEAERTYRTYQSNNAIFNAIIATVKENSSAYEQIRRLQTYNYALGLEPLAEVTGMAAVKGYDISLEQLQKNLEEIQSKEATSRAKIVSQKAFDDTVALVFYSIGSLLTLLASASKVFLPD